VLATQPRATRHAQAPSPFDALNPEQLDAVTHGDAPLLVIAGAGTGKTTTLAARVARLVLDGTDPQRLLLLTFSRRAASEMQHRAGRMLHQALGLPVSQAPPVLPWSGTFHSIGARLLRAHAPQLGLSEHFTVLDRADAQDLMGLVREAQGLADRALRFPLPATCLGIYSRCVNSRAPLAALLDTHFPWCSDWHDELKRLFGAYAAEKLRQLALDYDDLLLSWAQMLGEPALAALLRARFDRVLVDEYQDTNRLQAEILQGMVPDGRGLTAVGDDAQSIYGFRAAEVGNILGFAQQFGARSRVLPLQRNYRSTQPILDAANAVIALAAQRHVKTLWTDRASAERPRLVTVADELAQAGWVADDVLCRREQGLALKQQAVLFRTGHHAAALELELTRRRIPFVKFGGLKFLEAAHVKDVLSVLRWAVNPRARLAGWRAARLVAGIGPAAARRLLDAVDAGTDAPQGPPACRAPHAPQACQARQARQAWRPPAAAAADWRVFAALLDRLETSPAAAWPDDLAAVLDWYAPVLTRLYEADAPVRQADLDQLLRLASAHGTRDCFLTEMALDPPEATSDEAGPPLRDEDYLILSTIHSSKGQEWSAVTVLNVVDGCMPADMAAGSADEIEEERRLLYVAMTRAKAHLSLMVPQRFHVTQQHRLGDRHLYAGRSRFIPPSVAAWFDHVGPEPRASDSAEPGDPTQAPAGAAPAGPPGPAPTIDLAERLRAQWD